MSGTKIYNRWAAMKQRCLNPRNTQYPDYGGRGLELYEDWKNFLPFFADLGDAPPGLSLERFNNDVGYQPGNVGWATPLEQIANRRRPRRRSKRTNGGGT
jgi:hypothetical protein